MIDAEFVEHGRELVSVLSTVDVDRTGTQNGNTLTMQLHSEVVRYLTTYRHDDTTRLFEVHNVENALQRELVEIQTVAHVVVGRHGLRVVVNHDGLIAQLASGVDGVHRTPVELYRRTDTVCTRTEHDNRFFVLVVVDVVFGSVLFTLRISERRGVRVGEVEVVGEFRMLAGNGRNTLDRRQDALLLAVFANLQVLLLHIGGLGFQNEAGNLEVREATLLHLQQEVGGQVFQLVVLLQLVLQVNDMLQTLQEPDVNLGELLDALNGITIL